MIDRGAVDTSAERQYLLADAWRRWLIASCEEWTGGHRWMLELDRDEDGPTVHLGCEHCPACIDDVYPDVHDLMGGLFGDVTVQHGGHDSLVPLRIPVEIETWFSKIWTDYGWEYDAGVELYPFDPADASNQKEERQWLT